MSNTNESLSSLILRRTTEFKLYTNNGSDSRVFSVGPMTMGAIALISDFAPDFQNIGAAPISRQIDVYAYTIAVLDAATANKIGNAEFITIGYEYAKLAIQSMLPDEYKNFVVRLGDAIAPKADGAASDASQMSR